MWLHRIPLSSLCHSAGTSMAACARTLPKRHVVRTQRTYATQRTPLEYQRAKDFDTACYVVGAVIISGGISFASVPLYRAFCQVFARARTNMRLTAGTGDWPWRRRDTIAGGTETR
jgi:hypothetical protein